MRDIPDWLEEELNGGGRSSNTNSEIKNMSKEEIAEKAIREGRVKIDDERAIIRCPNTDSSAKWIKGGDTWTDTVKKMYACPVYPAPDPDNPGKSRMVCGGPMATKKEYKRNDYECYEGGCSRANDCPYHPDRL